MSDRCQQCEEKRLQVTSVLEDIQDRGCRQGFPNDMHLTAFTDWIRGLYPEYYSLTNPIGDMKNENA